MSRRARRPARSRAAGRGRAEVQPATVHRGGEAGGEGGIEHRGEPVVGFGAGPTRGLAGLQHLDQVAADGPLTERRVVGRAANTANRRRSARAPSGREADRVAVPDDQAHRREQRDHHVRRPRVDAEAGAERRRGRTGGDRASVNTSSQTEAGGHEVGGVEAVPMAVDRRRVGRGRGGEAGRHAAIRPAAAPASGLRAACSARPVRTAGRPRSRRTRRSPRSRDRSASRRSAA